MLFDDIYRDRRVMVTGHTGFKGSWLCQWLLNLGATVRGYALDPPTSPDLFEQLGLSSQLEDVRSDSRDRHRLLAEIEAFHPEFVFHLAAQPLVRYSYQQPVETYETNVMGTIHVLDSLRILNRPCIVIAVTTDKCYENREWIYGYRENEAMGGADPYSSSKGMAELAVSAYRRSYFQDGTIRVASVRAGNVIGGGDWATDRIVPDCVRALQKNEPIVVRNPLATRPWQHVLEPLHGYLLLAQQLHRAQPASDRLNQLCSGFNFGPESSSNRTVQELVNQLLQTIPGSWRNHCDPMPLQEAHLLHLCIDKAKSLLDWKPKWDFATSAKMTAEWYQHHGTGQDVRLLTQQQISAYAASHVAA